MKPKRLGFLSRLSVCLAAQQSQPKYLPTFIDLGISDFVKCSVLVPLVSHTYTFCSLLATLTCGSFLGC